MRDTTLWGDHLKRRVSYQCAGHMATQRNFSKSNPPHLESRRYTHARASDVNTTTHTKELSLSSLAICPSSLSVRYLL
jgi:hypothetical protein